MTSLTSHVYVDQRDDSAVTPYENERLSLVDENLSHMPYNVVDSYGILLKILDLTRNKFKNLDFLSEFPNLTSLILDRNELDSETVLPHLPNLQLLWLNYNKVDELFPFIRNLQRSCPNLRFLSMMGNPAAPSYLNGGTVYEHLQYRLFVISWFPRLIHMDDRYVTIHERKEANRLFCRPFLERLAMRGGVFDKISSILLAIERYFHKGHSRSSVI